MGKEAKINFAFRNLIPYFASFFQISNLQTLNCMVIINTTFLVSDKVYGSWMKWLREDYIPFMLESGTLSDVQAAKVLSDEVQEGTSVSVQFRADDLATLQLWRSKYEFKIQMNCVRKFGEEVLFFSTVLEVLL